MVNNYSAGLGLAGLKPSLGLCLYELSAAKVRILSEIAKYFSGKFAYSPLGELGLENLENFLESFVGVLPSWLLEFIA